ncbi:alanine dehydrogenase [Clostridium manihotivorum]|uniref:Alanine dehydrogenase n=1 Tax=Clostridium manihotivorum TaxID=2320868 RepID=A0A410DS08_9CLOT|nr:alanine dehydrogenase [Clostridium manihotivorum]QAA31815.1 alanine dehydrogenase [Clostridium manihotivorum]
MVIGLVREIKNNENRVGLTPSGVEVLIKRGHKVLVEKGAGIGSGFGDGFYKDVGAEVVDKKSYVFNQSDVIVKVKEPLEEEYDLFKTGQTLYTYLHLAANKPLTEVLLKKKITGIGYETVQLKNGRLPLLVPMSEIAGRMSVQIGANLLQKYNGGSGILLGGVPGVMQGEVVIIGGGIVGTNAAKIACGLGARVTIMDISNERLAYLDDIFFGRITTLTCNEYNVAKAVEKADLLIGAVLVAGASAPKIVSKEMVKTMKKGSVIVDVAIDQGGSIETIDRVTTHDDPCYEKYGVIHYSVANMPGAVPKTSTLALEAATLPYLIEIADNGVKEAILKDEALLLGLNTYAGSITCKAVAESLELPYVDPREIMVNKF